MEKLIGMTPSKARQSLEEEGKSLRVRVKDGQHLIGTCDFNTDRLNVEIKNNTIVKVLGFG